VKSGLSAGDLNRLAEVFDVLRSQIEEPIEVVPEIQEYTATEVARLLHRSNSWVSAHRVELGGYRDGPRGWWHFPGFAIRRFQENQSAAMARQEMRQAS
jgi:hypothetical protein